MSDCEKNIKIWNLKDYSVIDVVGGPSKQVAITPDGQYIISGNTDGKLKIINASDYSVSRVIENNGGPIASLAISDDGQYLAVGTWNGAVKVWDFHSGELIISHQSGSQ